MSFETGPGDKGLGAIVPKRTFFATTGTRALTGALLLLTAGLGTACSDDDDDDGGESQAKIAEAVRHWNQITVDASGIDHQDALTATALGPGRASRAMAIAHIAMFEAMNAVEGGPFESYIGLDPVPEDEKVSMRAAIAQAVFDTSMALYPNQADELTAVYDDVVNAIGNGVAKDNGLALGAEAADLILTMRAADGSQQPEVLYADYLTAEGPPDPGEWSQDPVNPIPLALGADWDEVTPFVLTSADQFRAPPLPALNSAEYTAVFEEEVAMGGDGVTTPHSRTQFQTDTGIYWAYDGVPNLCAPPRLYNQIVMQIVDDQDVEPLEAARLLALANVAMADATLCCWESKYFYKFWRPVTAIRGADTDGNDDTTAIADYTPLGAPASNINPGINFTPPFPAYPSGHATMGGALFEMLRNHFGTDDIEFTFTSDELNGVTEDNAGVVRPLSPRTFSNFSDPEEENGQSRIYLGIHWQFDKTEGIAMGREVADFVFDNLYQPASK